MILSYVVAELRWRGLEEKEQQLEQEQDREYRLLSIDHRGEICLEKRRNRHQVCGWCLLSEIESRLVVGVQAKLKIDFQTCWGKKEQVGALLAREQQPTRILAFDWGWTVKPFLVVGVDCAHQSPVLSLSSRRNVVVGRESFVWLEWLFLKAVVEVQMQQSVSALVSAAFVIDVVVAADARCDEKEQATECGGRLNESRSCLGVECQADDEHLLDLDTQDVLGLVDASKDPQAPALESAVLACFDTRRSVAALLQFASAPRRSFVAARQCVVVQLLALQVHVGLRLRAFPLRHVAALRQCAGLRQHASPSLHDVALRQCASLPLPLVASPRQAAGSLPPVLSFEPQVRRPSLRRVQHSLPSRVRPLRVVAALPRPLPS